MLDFCVVFKVIILPNFLQVYYLLVNLHAIVHMSIMLKALIFHVQSQGGHGIFGGGGGLTPSRHQPSVPPLNQSPGMRAQVPHQFLSPQVVMHLQSFLWKKRSGSWGMSSKIPMSQGFVKCRVVRY